MMESCQGVMRAVGGLEGLMWLTGEATPNSVSFVARYRGEISEAVLKRALRAVQRRHPLLSSRTQRLGRQLCFVHQGEERTLEIPVTLAESSASWVELVEEEIRFRFHPETGDWARCAWIPQTDGGTLILTMHHMICDGISLFHVMNDIFESCDQQNRGLSPELPLLGLKSPIESLLPHSHVKRGLAGAIQTFRSLRMQRRERQRFGQTHAVVRLDAQEPFSRQKRRIIPIFLEEIATAELKERARSEGTTVHGALGAALLFSLLDELQTQGKDSVLALGNPFNLRHKLTPTVGDDCALFATFGISFHQLSAELGFWSLARSIRSQNQAAIRRGDPFHGIRAVGAIASNRLLLPYTPAGVGRYVSLFNSRYRDSATTGLTNIGALGFRRPLQTLTCEWGGFIPSQALLCYTSLTACTVNERMMLNFLYTEPNISMERGSRIAARIRDLLVQAVSSAPPQSPFFGHKTL